MKFNIGDMVKCDTNDSIYEIINNIAGIYTIKIVKRKDNSKPTHLASKYEVSFPWAEKHFTKI